MQLLRVNDVPVSPGDRVFRYSRGRVIVMVAAALAASVLSIAVGRQQHSVLLYYIAVVVSGGLLVLQTFVTARFRSSNWLVRANDEGLFVQFRSYLNYRFPADRPTVAFIPYGAIRSARAVREWRELPDRDSTRHPNSSTVQRSTMVYLELAGSLAPIAPAIDEEIRLAVGESRLPLVRTRYRHAPVSLTGNTLQLEWAVAPSAGTLLTLLSSHHVPTDTAAETTDYAHMETLDRDEQEKRLRELVERGDTIAAVRITRQLHGWDLTAAKAFVDGLHRSGNSSTPDSHR